MPQDLHRNLLRKYRIHVVTDEVHTPMRIRVMLHDVVGWNAI